MSKEFTIKQLNKKLAAALGWTELEYPNYGLMIERDWIGYPPVFIIGKKQSVPNYCGDYWRVADLEYSLTKDEKIAYSTILLDKVSKLPPNCAFNLITLSLESRVIALTEIYERRNK